MMHASRIGMDLAAFHARDSNDWEFDIAAVTKPVYVGSGIWFKVLEHD